MSESVAGNTQAVLVEDRRIAWSGETKFGVIKSGSQNTYVVLPTQTYSTSNFSFNAQPPAPNIAINREIFIRCQITVTMTGTAGPSGTLLSLGTGDAPRFMPLAQITNSISATINNGNVSQNNYQVVNALFRYNTPDNQYKTDLSVAPSMPDYYQNYDDNYVNGWGVVNDPLQAIGQTSQGWETRGGFPLDNVVNPNVGAGNPATASVTFTTTEPLILSPFLEGTDDHKAFIGVQVLTLNLNLTNLQRVWCHSLLNGNNGIINPATPGSVVVTFPTAPSLLLNFITPSAVDPIPAAVTYNYANVDVYTTDPGSALAGLGTNTLPSQNIQLNTIPRRIYCFLRRRDNDSTLLTTDTFARINSVSINFDNTTGLLAGANSAQLYELSKNSGLNMSWAQWSTYTGSVLCLDMGRSIMLKNEAEAPSLQTTKQLQIQVNYTNLNTNPVWFYLYILVVSDGLMTIANNATFLQNSVLSPGDITSAKESGHVESWERANTFYGGGFFKGLKKAVKKVAHHVNEGLKSTGIVSNALTTVSPQLGQVASHFGYGREQHGGRRVSKAKLLTYR